MYNLDKTDKESLTKIKKITSEAMQNGYDVFAFSASNQTDYNKLKKEFDLDFDMLFCDETTLKTIIRANPGIVTIRKGTITGKWNANDADSIKLE